MAARSMILLKLVIGAAVAYGAVVLLAWKFQERLAFPAPRQRLSDPAQRGLSDARQVEILTSDSVRLRGWFLPPRPAPQGPAPALLWFTGNAETVASLAPRLRDLRPSGVAMLAVDYRGYGESDGSPTEAGIYRDAEAAWGYLASRPEVDRSRIAVYGRSLGTAAALHVAVSRRVRAVVLDAPFTNAREMARLHYNFLPRRLLRLQLDNLGAAGRLRAPLLVFHGTTDDIVPIEMGRAVAEAGHAREFVAVQGAGHNDLHDIAGDRYREKFQAFLAAILGF